LTSSACPSALMGRVRTKLPEAILSGRSEARETSTFQGLTKEVNRMGKELGAPALRRVPLVCIVN
jgi:hypothetical protein